MMKRLLTGLLAGGLMVGMLPGVASADPSQDKGGPTFGIAAACITKEGVSVAAAARGPAGFAQQFVRTFIAHARCDHKTLQVVQAKSG